MATILTPKFTAEGASLMDGRELVHIQGLSKSFGSTTVLHSVDLSIREGEFFTLLGPSGSGKTTMLRLISGFDAPDGGCIRIDGIDVANIPPHKREVNTVFQDYALFPHMTVLENIAYGPRAAKVARNDALNRAREALAMVKLGAVADRRPGQLSGGQRQRVAMARAIVNHPRVLLLDEPLGALDLKLRHEMQYELQRIQRELGITFIYVTHDQEEALTMSDRIAVFEHGRIAQIASPAELYERPTDAFVAGFVGVSNILERDRKRFLVRPERMALHAQPQGDSGLVSERGKVVQVTYLGMIIRYLVRIETDEILNVAALNCGRLSRDPAWVEGDMVWVDWRRNDMVLLG